MKSDNKLVGISFALMLVLVLISNTTGQTLAPLAVGNMWVYQEKENSDQRIKYYLSDTVTIGGNVYYECMQSNLDTIAIHFRLREEGIYVQRMHNVDYPYYKTNFGMKDTIRFKQWYGTWRFIMTEETNENIFGKEVSCKNIVANMIFMNNNEKWTEEFGLILGINSNGSEYYVLKGCVINGTLYGDTSMTVTNIHDDALETGYILEQNYPNPFNPSTVISYKMPIAGYVTLKIYDVLGREVVSLVNEFKQQGIHHSTFNTLNSTLTSGVYFYVLKIDNTFVETKKMLLLK